MHTIHRHTFRNNTHILKIIYVCMYVYLHIWQTFSEEWHMQFILGFHMPKHIPECIHEYHAHIHKCIFIYLHTHILTHTQEKKENSVPVCLSVFLKLNSLSLSKSSSLQAREGSRGHSRILPERVKTILTNQRTGARSWGQVPTKEF